MFDKVIVGFDGSEQARRALSLASALTAPGGELVVCCVHRFDTLSARIDPTEPRLERAAAERAVAEAVATVDGPFTVSSLLLEGAGAGPTLLRAIVDRRADLLVLGSSHHGTTGRMLIGSVTEEVVRAAACPVLIVPPPAPC